MLADIAPGRLLPWLPVAFGAGIALYFTAEHEPSVWAAAILAIICVFASVLLRRRAVAFSVALALTAAAAGFATATVRAAVIAHPVLQSPVVATVSGWVEIREERERSDRIVIRAHHIDGGRMKETPDRVRVAVRKGTAPDVGAFVELKARLSPPVTPLRPGGYDFARDQYFQRIGASGFVLGKIKAVDPPEQHTWRLSFAAAVDGIRESIDKRIRAVIPGNEGAIASALLTGKRDAITQNVNDAMYISSLAHVLSISGYHMALVATVVFFIVRAGLALLPTFASRYPIKKLAAVITFFVATFYLILSGAEVATQRSYIMLIIVLLAVLVDRTALTLRTLAIAALAVMLLSPESVVHPSFQMSFAATLALIAVYTNGMALGRLSADNSLRARIALWGGREVAALILASLVAGLATMPYAAYHFHRAAPYGVIANLFAMPVVSAWVMPMGLFGLLALPFGFDGFFWRMMGYGIQWMETVALWVSSLPGAVGRVTAFGVGPLLLGTAGILLLCLLRTPLRWSGAAVAALATCWALATPVPDAFVAADGKIAAVRNSEGRLSVLKNGTDSFAIREWLNAVGDERQPKDKSLNDGTKCDQIGCVTQLADGRLLALSLSADSLADDCRRAAILVTQGNAPPECAALTIDRQLRLQTGAISIVREGKGFAVIPSRPPGYDRPWARAVQIASPAASPPVPEATPREEDLEPGD